LPLSFLKADFPDPASFPAGTTIQASDEDGKRYQNGSGAWVAESTALPDPSAALDGKVLATSGGAYVLAPNTAAQPSRSGLISEWLLDEGQGATAFNNVYPHQPALNIWGPILLAGDFVNATPTLNFAESPAGGFTALRVQFTGNAYYDHSYPFVNGRHYTISTYAKSNSGGNQKFRMASDAIAYSSDFTATTSWQRFSYSFVASGGINFFPMSTDAAAENADILFWGLQLDNGDHPTPYVTPNFGMTLGLFPNANDSSPPTWNSGGYLHFASAGSQYARSISEQPISSYQASIYVVFRRVGSTNINGLAPLLGAPGLSLLQIDYGSQNGIGADLPNFLFTNQSVGATATSNDGAWHLLCGIIDGSKLHIYLDDTEVAVASISGNVTPLVLYSLLLGNLNEAAYFAGDIAYASVYSVGHTQAQYLANRAQIQSLMSARSISIPDLDAFIAFEGDSISSVDVGTPPYPTLEMRALLRQGRIFAISGSKVSDMNNRAATIDALYKASRRRNILSILIGRNDLDADAPATFVANLKAYCLARRATGWKIVLKTILPSTESGFNALRNTANALIVADTSFYDHLVRLDQDTTIGQDSDASNLTYYSDGTHPTNAGCAIIASDEEPAITLALA
jgi:hypothetical protein